MIYSRIHLDARYPMQFPQLHQPPDRVHSSDGFHLERRDGEDFVRVSRDGHEEFVPWHNVKQATPLVQDSEKVTTPPPPPIDELVDAPVENAELTPTEAEAAKTHHWRSGKRRR